HPAIGFAALTRIGWPQRAGGVLGREIAHAAVALPDDPAAVVDGRHDAVGVHVEVPFLVVAAERHADILALVLQPALVGAPQYLHDIDRIGAAPDLHPSTPSTFPRRLAVSDLRKLLGVLAQEYRKIGLR